MSLSSPSSTLPAPEEIHPALWMASQLARGRAQGVETGFDALSAELPERGWPPGMLIELLLPQAGIGELRLLRPALGGLPCAGASRPGARPNPGRIALLQAPHRINAPGWARLGIAPSRLLQLHADKASDAWWAAEQVLRADSCRALLLWQTQIRSDALRRLHLAAQSGSTLFFMLRPLTCERDASPAPLRLALRPAADGIEVRFLKRRGPQRDTPLFIPLSPSPNLLHRHVPVDRRTPAVSAAGSVPTELVE
ncbi:translesion DNA synthesis-associated protein ImuA [Herbaspirillum lusitanum]|uniref:Translesion DNA synthesis-associated protein ImuA n=1 Tax=Herbaspirillum lusitanum TaxID=213312 RepID=A0ABW9ABJ3_9BURK